MIVDKLRNSVCNIVKYKWSQFYNDFAYKNMDNIDNPWQLLIHLISRDSRYN